MCSTPWASRNSSAWSRKRSAASSSAPCRERSRHVRPFDAPPISAFTRRSRRACIGSASSSRLAGCRSRRCGALPGSRATLGDGDMRLTVWQNLLISGVPTVKLPERQAAHRSARPRHRDQCHPLRARRLHRQYRLQVRRFRHQASRRGDRSLVRDARRARYAGQYPSDRLPSFLRAAFRFRDRAARLQGPGGRGCRSGRGLSFAGRRRLRAECRARPRALSRRQRGGRAAHRRADLKAYLAHRASREETFIAFARRHEIDALKAMAEAEAAA